MKTNQIPNKQGSYRRKKPVSGPAIIVLIIVLAAIWFGSQSLSKTKTVIIENSTQEESILENNTDQKPTNTNNEQPKVDEKTDSKKETSQTEVASMPKLPEGYPNSIPAPNNSTLNGGYGTPAGNQKSYAVTYSVKASAENVSQAYQAQLSQAGFIVDAFPAPGGEQFFGAQKEALSFTVSVTNDEKQEGTSIITISVVME